MVGESFMNNERGQVGGVGKAAIGIILALFVVGLLAAVLAPVAVNALENPSEQTVTQSVNDTTELAPGLNATLDSVTTSDATYTLQTDEGESETQTISEGSNATFTFTNGDVTVTVDSVDSANDQATTTYEYPTDFGWGSGASSLWAILGLFVVFGVFFVVLSIAMKSMR